MSRVFNLNLYGLVKSVEASLFLLLLLIMHAGLGYVLDSGFKPQDTYLPFLVKNSILHFASQLDTKVTNKIDLTQSLLSPYKNCTCSWAIGSIFNLSYNKSVQLTFEYSSFNITCQFQSTIDLLNLRIEILLNANGREERTWTYLVKLGKYASSTPRWWGRYGSSQALILNDRIFASKIWVHSDMLLASYNYLRMLICDVEHWIVMFCRYSYLYFTPPFPPHLLVFLPSSSSPLFFPFLLVWMIIHTECWDVNPYLNCTRK